MELHYHPTFHMHKLSLTNHSTHYTALTTINHHTLFSVNLHSYIPTYHISLFDSIVVSNYDLFQPSPSFYIITSTIATIQYYHLNHHIMQSIDSVLSPQPSPSCNPSIQYCHHLNHHHHSIFSP
jgi:hypothetical protein